MVPRILAATARIPMAPAIIRIVIPTLFISLPANLVAQINPATITARPPIAAPATAS